MPSPDISVEVNNLTRKFGNFTAVDNVSFEVKRGEVFGFLGPNGAGKSTTIRMLCGIIAPTSGTGTVSGIPLGKNSDKIKSIIGYMSQKFSLYEDLSVFENLDFYSGVYPIPKGKRCQRVDEALEISGLTKRKDHITGTLPGGLKQKLALACSLLHQPEVLFLDEPTAGVDPLSRRNFWEMIYKLSESGVTVFVTTHYMDEAEHCDRIAFIASGKLIKTDSPENLKQTSRKLLEIECSDWAKAIEILSSNEAEIGESALFGVKIHVSPNPGAEDIIKSMLSASECGFVSVKEILPSLEDVFVSLLKSEK
ncbi:MAG: ABC transporter ATP-binding protein [candidate division Zixibacteria bacterium]|nr:ABC transporter ATP-binding protein [candidate division Zixibacteria bacterium]